MSKFRVRVEGYLHDLDLLLGLGALNLTVTIAAIHLGL